MLSVLGTVESLRLVGSRDFPVSSHCRTVYKCADVRNMNHQMSDRTSLIFSQRDVYCQCLHNVWF